MQRGGTETSRTGSTGDSSGSRSRINCYFHGSYRREVETKPGLIRASVLFLQFFAFNTE
jgi:hypothetical protein